MQFPGYTLQAELHRGRKRVVYRARRESDGSSVILKTFAAEFPSPSDTASLRREHEILRDLEIPGVARALALEKHHDRLALVLADAGETTLKAQIGRGRIDLLAAISYGRQLASALATLHRAGIVHKDVNSNNIVIDVAAGRATLADFGIASRAPSEAHHPGLPHLIEGTLAYMSPEQTGRMNRDLDYRTDLYSLGVTLYEMLTGRLPYESTDPLEVIHGHVARTATAPQQLDPGIPRVLSDLVVRLMAKSAEDRYQSGDGVAADLARCTTALTEAGRVSDFPLGQDDVRDHFVIPQRLYGRREEVDQLLAAFERVAQGRAELVLVSGYSGIGKTSLIREIYRSLPHQRGHFIQGKFDQLARDVPYAALAQAFQTLVRQLLSETEDGVQTWRKTILAAVGANGQVVIDVLPELARLIGEQPEMPPLESTESQVRFNLVFQQFVGAFARAEHPLVLFLDDLQWADAATLSLLPLFLANPDLKGLLIIGAYRDNEVSPSHPLAGVVRDLVARGAPVTELVLPPLNAGHVTELLSDTLGGGGTIAQELGALVFEKTGGNPFFMTQFLKSLYHDGQIALDRTSRGWWVDFAAIRGLKTTENVVDLMTDRIQRLGPETQGVLRLAACVGNRFDLATLATVCERGVRECMADLWPALEGGLVTADEQSYGFAPDLTDGKPPEQRRFRFLHDRVQQAAYALIPETDKRQAHLTVGRLLLARADEPQADGLFDVVNQLNYGAELITEPAERLRLAELNLAAGRKAAASAAFPSAAGYFGAGTALLPEDAWSSHHDLAFALHLLRAESEYLSGRFTEAEAGFAALLARCRSPKERTDVYFLMVSQLETQSRYSDAIRIGREGLRTLDVDLPEDQATQQAALTEDIEAIDGLLGQQPIASVVDAPAATDPRIREALRLLRALWAPAFISTSGSLPALAASRMVRLSLEHGNTEDSAFGYLHHAITVGSLLGQYERGHEFGLLALAINERLKDQRLRAVIHHRFAALVNPWRRPFSSCFTHAREAVRAGLESGNLQVAGYAQFQQTWYGMHVEPTLEGFSERYGPIVDFLAKLQTPAFLEAQRLFLQWARAHQARTDGPTSLDDGQFREFTYLQTYGRGGIFRGMYFTIKLELLFAHGLVEEAKAAADDGEPAVEQFFGSIWPAAFAFWHLLTLCAWLPRVPETRRRPVQEKIDHLLGRLEVWSRNAPENFAHWHLLGAAEVARVRDAPGVAFEHYEAALARLEQQETSRYRALANELYGAFWLGRGQRKVAAAFLSEARYGYEQWGAHAKVAELTRRYGSLFGSQPVSPGPRTLQTTQALETALDVGTVIKASQALAGEIDLEQLLGRLMHAAIAHAGAERGRFILEHQGSPAVHVRGSAGSVEVEAGSGTPLGEAREIPLTLINLVRRTGETIVLADAAVEGLFTEDTYIAASRPRSILCTPVVNQGQLIGVLYLENNLASGVFTEERAQVLQILAVQAAIAIENARLFGEIRRLKDRLQAENVYLIEEIKTQNAFGEIVGRTPVLQRVLAQVEKVAPTDTTVLVTGETGTGKELVARALHNLSRRKDRPLVTVNCGAISPGLVESELFGHEKGAFTGAISRKIGRFELADGGTIFLDEVGDLPADLQVKLLRVLQEGEIDRVGGSRAIKVDVRVIAATHRNLEQLVQQGKFRSDLFYRLNVFPIRMPALRERRDDIPLLVRYFVLKYAQKLGKRIESIPPEVMESLCAYEWPGNIRELGNVLERSVIVSRGSALELGDWIPAVRRPGGNGAPVSELPLEEVERAHILATLERAGWKVSGARGAAAALGLKPTTLESRMKKLGITRPR